MMNESRKKAFAIQFLAELAKGKLKGFKSLFLPSLSTRKAKKSRK